MDDLWQRILAQNDEVDRMNAERDAIQARLAEHEAYAHNTQRWQQENHWQQPTQEEKEPMMLSAAALDMQERELDRQLEMERMQQQQQQPKRGTNAGPPRTGGRLQHAAAQSNSRGKIPLMPSRGGAPPSSCGTESRSGAPRPPPSCAGSGTPSVAGSMAPSLRQPRPVHYTHLMHDKTAASIGSGGQMDAFLNPVDGIRGQMKRAGIEPKNHIRENRALLAEMAEVQLQRKEAIAYEAEDKQRRNAAIRDRSRARAQQTLAEHGMDISDSYSDAPPSRGASAGRRSMRPPPTGQEAPPPKPRPHEPGRVPAYLQRRKAEWAAEAEEIAMREAMAAECPPGTRLVGAEEKARILEKLAEERAKASVELRQLPFVIKTNATQLKKDRLEARLEEIAGAEEAYMRDKVFVPADM